MAPEQFDDIMSSKLDIWQFGCLLLEMITGKEPYCGLKNDFAMLKLQNDGISPLDHYRNNIMRQKENIRGSKILREEEEVILVLERCFQFDYQERPRAEEVRKMAFFNLA